MAGNEGSSQFMKRVVQIGSGGLSLTGAYLIATNEQFSTIVCGLYCLVPAFLGAGLTLLGKSVRSRSQD